MKNLKRIAALSLALAMALALVVPGSAAGAAGFTDVPAGAWYKDAVKYVHDNGLMDGVGGGRFNPGGDTSRAMLVTILWRMADRPVVNYLMQFPDVGEGWYTEAVRWAASERIVEGYGNGRFGTNDPVSREDLVTILWRYTGRQEAESGQDFADEADISAHAIQAVDWAQAKGLINGKPGNRFDPRGRATRAEAAAILQKFQPLNSTPSSGGKALVVYFSATGSTQRVGGYIADAVDADLFELTPVEPYSSADLNWTDPSSRVNREHNDESLRDVKLVASTVDNWADYDTVFIGYPIWWGIAAWPVNDFVKNNDFTGKTVIPFCTSSSSGLGRSGALLAEMAGTGDWLNGMRFPSGASREQVAEWAAGPGVN